MAANPQGATEEDAAAQILSILEPQTEAPEEDKTQEAAAETEETKEEATEEAQPEKEVETVEIDPEEKLFDVEEMIEGGTKETRKYSLNELKAQRMMQADYQRKTAELARQREEVQTQIRQGIEGEKKQYADALAVQQKLLWNIVAPELGKVDLDVLAADDPAEYVKVQNKLNKFNQIIQWTQAEQAKLAQQEREHLEKVVLPKAAEQIQRDIPNWGPEVQKAIAETGRAYGFSSEELANVYDPRMIKVLHDAHQFKTASSQSNKAREIAMKKVVEKPKVVKPGTKQPVKEDGESLQRLKKTGRLDDAAAAILSRL